MPMPGYVFKDGGPIPDSELRDPQHQLNHQPGATPVMETKDTATITSPSNSVASTMVTPTSSASASNAPSESHALAAGEHEEIGHVQKGHEEGEVRDMGWNDHPKDVPQPLVGGLPNEELWTLVRRFNKQMYHVKATNAPLLGGLDLNIVDEDEFSPDKLRSNLERLYMTVIIGLMGFGKQIARLRSWREPRRTAGFCAAYFIAWVFNLVLPLILVTFIVLIVYPPSRPFLFPPAPLALVDSKTGGVQTPHAGVLGSHDSATGAPEKHKGEAVEQEAHNFVSGIGSIALSSAVGKHEPGDPNSDPINESVPDPTNMASDAAAAKQSAQGANPTAKHDKTKQPMEQAMWTKMRPIMHVVGEIADTWERFANALSPTAPFPQEAPRLRLAGVLVPIVAVTLFTSPAMFMKATYAGVGFGFFGDPLIWRGLDLLNRKVPNWQKYLELENSLLKGIPTNAQLTITLLRIGEANKAPLPPPPRSDEPPPSKPASLNGDDLTLDASNEEIHDAIHKDPAEKAAEEHAAANPPEKKKHKHGEHILGFFKGTTKTGVDTKFGIDNVRAKLGNKHAKDHLGILPNPNDPTLSGPVDFKGRYQGQKGWIYVSTNVDIPTVSFSTESSDGTGLQPEKASAKFSIPIQDIRELKKIGGLGWKSKIVVGWATGKTIADGLEIVTRNGETHKLTAIRLRDELFNRLVAMGGQKWESW
ncbi:hypothetical protein JMJ35_004092 [Cladonia borealis]|uniref:Uncharacterized protein n=1 Tax=Cladonia borealis TaxID=184061 RepID=A0AA39R310_9LECA|nr:hypothetical protein JMJ35_004092 [Cladonia borealis]